MYVTVAAASGGDLGHGTGGTRGIFRNPDFVTAVLVDGIQVQFRHRRPRLSILCRLNFKI